MRSQREKDSPSNNLSPSITNPGAMTEKYNTGEFETDGTTRRLPYPRVGQDLFVYRVGSDVSPRLWLFEYNTTLCYAAKLVQAYSDNGGLRWFYGEDDWRPHFRLPTRGDDVELFCVSHGSSSLMRSPAIYFRDRLNKLCHVGELEVVFPATSPRLLDMARCVQRTKELSRGSASS